MSSRSARQTPHAQPAPPAPGERRAKTPAAPAQAPSLPQQWRFTEMPVHPQPKATPKIVSKNDPREQQACAGTKPRLASLPGPQPESLPSWLPTEPGRPLSAQIRDPAQRQLDADFSNIRLHDSEAARAAAFMLGAKAFAAGNHIYLGPQSSETDSELMRHELIHTLQANGEVYLRSATWVERRAWLAFFDHYLPRKFLNNYMDDTGAAIKLTQQEMIDCNPIVDLNNSKPFLAEVAALKTKKGGTKAIAVSGWGGALTNGTLGNFTINYKGNVTVTASGDWNFSGTMNFHDYWDFDPKPFNSGSGRPIPAEIKVRVANTALPGQPFDINSVDVPVSQKSGDDKASWAGGTPTHVGDKAGRTGADIAAGADTGTADTGGDVGGTDVGGEAGNQSSEDLNKGK